MKTSYPKTTFLLSAEAQRELAVSLTYAPMEDASSIISDFIRKHSGPAIAEGYRLDELMVQGWPRSYYIEVKWGCECSPLTLWARRTWRRFVPYSVAA